MKPIVTVLTTVYNGLPYLKEAIESILNQTYKDFEFLIIDDASPDEKVIECIKSFKDPRIRFIRNKKNLGVSNTINKALSIIKTTYIVRSDQDDVSLPNRIQEQIDYLENHPEISILCSWEHTVDSEGRRGRDLRRVIKNYGDFLGPILLGVCPIWHPSIAFRTDAMIEVGGFNAKYIRAEDFEVTTRLALKRHGSVIIPKFHLLLRQHNQSQSKEFAHEQAKMSKRIQTEALSEFMDINDAKQLSRFLRLEKDNSNNPFNKKHIIDMHHLLLKMFDNIARKQELNSEELHSLRKTIFKRVGLGVYCIPVYKYLPSFLFMPFFYLLSPLFSNSLHKAFSRIYNALQKLRYRMR